MCDPIDDPVNSNNSHVDLTESDYDENDLSEKSLINDLDFKPDEPSLCIRILIVVVLLLLTSSTVISFLPSSYSTFEKSLYDVLEVKKTASTKQLTKSYRKLAKIYHPDRCTLSTVQQCEDKWSDVNTAYKTLTNPQKRLEYDRSLV
ncbi:hypothetical protein GEMRC1_003415 [Eukaryota sp. GEM-RC1]